MLDPIQSLADRWRLGLCLFAINISTSYLRVFVYTSTSTWYTQTLDFAYVLLVPVLLL